MLLNEENGNHMKATKFLLGSAVVAVGALALAGCSGSGSGDSSDGKVKIGRAHV